jgi:proteasome assembly chaperone (PAC2) family protein
MIDGVELWEQPAAEQVYMMIGWRQWADAGSISSGLPEYLIRQSNARQIGKIDNKGFYLFQIPGTHDLVRPVVKFEDGYPASLETQRNEIYYSGDSQRGIVFLIGDEPHIDVERYATACLSIAKTLRVKRIVSFGGVYGELPYDKERMVSGIYSQKHLKEEMLGLSVNLSDYHGGASIGSYLCRRAGEQDLELVGFYGFVPTYDFSSFAQISSAIRIENDFAAWLGVMRRVNYMLKTDFDLGDLERKCKQLVETIEAKVEELDRLVPQAGVREYLASLSDDFVEVVFDPMDEVWEDEIRRLFDDSDSSGV